MQIVIQTDKIDISRHMQSVEAFKEEEPYLSDMVEDYLGFIQTVTKQKESMSRKFYVILEQKVPEEKLFSYFEMVGNEIKKCSESEMKEMLKRCFRRDSGVRRGMKWV